MPINCHIAVLVTSFRSDWSLKRSTSQIRWKLKKNKDICEYIVMKNKDARETEFYLLENLKLYHNRVSLSVFLSNKP